MPSASSYYSSNDTTSNFSIPIESLIYFIWVDFPAKPIREHLTIGPWNPFLFSFKGNNDSPLRNIGMKRNDSVRHTDAFSSIQRLTDHSMQPFKSLSVADRAFDSWLPFFFILVPPILLRHLTIYFINFGIFFFSFSFIFFLLFFF